MEVVTRQNHPYQLSLMFAGLWWHILTPFIFSRKYPLRHFGVLSVILWAYPSPWSELKGHPLHWPAGWWLNRRDHPLIGRSSELTQIFLMLLWQPPQRTLLPEPQQVSQLSWLHVFLSCMGSIKKFHLYQYHYWNQTYVSSSHIITVNDTFARRWGQARECHVTLK